jgi:tetratricopeptide (TPR) repeat protein
MKCLLAVSIFACGAALQKLANGDDAAALVLDEAQATATDPGDIAYHRGVALARLGRYAEAEEAFRQCLADDAIPAERYAKACYNRGVCLVECGGARDLRLAIDCFTACREIRRDDAVHNLAIAKLRLLKIREQSPNDPGSDEPQSKPANNDVATGESESGDAAKAAKVTAPRPTNDKEATKAANAMAPGAGTLPVIRDESVLNPLGPEETAAALESIAERLKRQRRNVDALRAGADKQHPKDW